MLTKQQTLSIVKHLRALADVFESSTSNSVEPPVEKSKRGRKPGAVDAQHRCTGTNGNGEQCKNRATQGQCCGKHLSA